MISRIVRRNHFITVVNVNEAKTYLSRLPDAAVAGEEVIIDKRGRPFVKLAPVLVKDRTPGTAKGKGRLTEMIAQFAHVRHL